ncbi:MFS transporter [Ktedonosporobacter rubrisoli]|uniref:MFS transporter n=1 Tax=Ktedonosporobacter rubrisoli TaxID=2509675 RepID=A0A4P6JKV7_KTERU|nr:MFS transporter [Ktedonosporobacter rubrisoli]QBD75837.1 MFS transporter [Ktedonosporobacter rubrisoli]
METQIKSSSSPQAENRLDARRWLMLAVVLSAAFIGTVDEFIINIAVPSIEHELHTNFAEVQLVVAGYTLAFAVFLVTGGRMGDIYGRKRLFILGVASFTLFSALCGFAASPLLLIIFRLAQGIAAAAMIPQVISFIQVNFAPSERPLAFGIYAAVSGLASILGQVFGGFLLTANLFNLGWRSVFLVNVPIGIIALLAAFPLIQESREQDARRLDYGGAILLTISLFLLVFPLVMGGNAGWPLWSIICLLLFVPSMAIFLVYEQRLTKQGKLPLVSLGLFRQRRFPAGLLTNLLATMFFGGLMFLLAFYLQTILHLTPLQAGLAFLASSITFILASSINPFLFSRLGKWGMSIAAALVTLAYLLLVLSAQWLVPLWGIVPLIVALFMIGFGMGSLVTPLMNKTLEEVTHQDVGTASGVYTTASQVAVALGVALLGLLFSMLTTSGGDALHAFVITLLVTTLLSLVLSLTVLPLRKPAGS